jgi:hypothetical protein
MNSIVVGLKYDPGMNFHELVCHGLKLSDLEKKELLLELRRRYSDLISSKEGSAEVKLTTQIKELNWETAFVPLVIPSGNDRFKNVYLFSSTMADPRRNEKQQGQMNECLNESSLREMVMGILNNEINYMQFAKQSLVRATRDDPSCINELLFVGAAILATLSVQSNQKRTSAFESAITDEIRKTRFSKCDTHRFWWLSGFRSKRTR